MTDAAGTESYNVFEHNFAMRSEGSGDFAPRSGYSGAGPDPGGEGGGFWFRGPNNYIRNNVAANADVFGFQLAAGLLESVRIPAFKGADIFCIFVGRQQFVFTHGAGSIYYA